MNTINKVADTVSKYMLYILIGGIALGFFWPTSFMWAGKHTTTLLSIIMFCMGMTLDTSSFKSVAKKPKAAIIGLLCQFTIMPLAAFLLTKVFPVPLEIAVGIILVGATPGGTASNVMTYIGGGDVALTVSMTAIATLLAAVVTPLLTLVFVGQYVAVSFMAMLLSVVKMVLVPVVLGVVLRKVFGKKVDKASKVFVLFSSISVLLIVGSMIAANKEQIIASGLVVIVILFIHNLIGYAAGYSIARLAGVDDAQCRSITFQVGMKNTGLAMTLGKNHFSPLTAVPGAIGGPLHQITGTMLARFFMREKKQVTDVAKVKNKA